jgi:signal transduction histidine kinase
LDEALRKSDKLAVVGRLAASIAHEINNPLEAVTNALYLLAGTALNAQQRQYLDTAQQELMRVAEIAAQTLTFNRQSNVRGQASVSSLLNSVLALYRPRLTNSKIAIERRYQNTAPIVCFPGELRQAFANLIGNAFDATRKGGRIILCERYAVHPKTGQDGIRITVADTGDGMSAEVKAHLFEAFHSTKGMQGTGLGLWISKGIVDRHSGSIRVRSSTRLGRSGTVFSIFLPRDPRQGLEPAPASLQNTGTG